MLQGVYDSILHYVWSAFRPIFLLYLLLIFSLLPWVFLIFILFSFLSLSLPVLYFQGTLALLHLSIALLSPAALPSCSVIALFRSSSSCYRPSLVGFYLLTSSWWLGRFWRDMFTWVIVLPTGCVEYFLSILLSQPSPSSACKKDFFKPNQWKEPHILYKLYTKYTSFQKFNLHRNQATQ